MYNRTSEKHNTAVLIDKRLLGADHRRDDEEDKGQYLVKSDGHGWEPEIN
jgi:hypothetical protein